MRRVVSRAAAVLCAAAALLTPDLAHAVSPASPRSAPAVKRPARKKHVAATPAPPPQTTTTKDEQPPMPSEPQPAVIETVAAPPSAESTPAPAEAAAAEAAPAEKKLEVGGRLFTYIRAPFAIDKPLQQLSSSLWIDARARMSTATFAAVSVVGDLMTPSVEGKVEARARLREAYAGVHTEGFEARVGHQIHAWGNADGLHAVDFLTAQDYSFYSVSADARQIGAPSLALSYSPDDGTSPLKLTAVWQPVFPASKVFVPKSNVPAQAVVLDEDRPQLSLGNSEVAAKISWAPGGWDVSLIGFHGFNHLSEAYLKSVDTNANVAQVGRNFHEINALGVQASVALDAWVLRLEAAYVVTENPNGRGNRFVQPSHGDVIVGVERPLGERVRLGVQGLCRFHPYYLSLRAPFSGPAELQVVNRAIATTNARLLNYTDQVRPGASVAVAYTSEDESLELSVAALAYFVGADFVVQPMIGYRLFDALKVDIGAQVFGGEESSLGFLASQNGVFAQATYTF